jgi:hypothetical protein
MSSHISQGPLRAVKYGVPVATGLDRFRVSPQVLLKQFDAARQLFRAESRSALARFDTAGEYGGSAQAFRSRIAQHQVAAFLGDERLQMRDQFRQTTGLRLTRERGLRTDCKNRRRVQDFSQPAPHVAECFFFFCRAPNVRFGDHKHDLVSTLFDQLVLKELSLAFLQRLPRIQHKQHRVRPRDVAVGDLRASQ